MQRVARSFSSSRFSYLARMPSIHHKAWTSPYTGKVGRVKVQAFGWRVSVRLSSPSHLVTNSNVRVIIWTLCVMWWSSTIVEAPYIQPEIVEHGKMTSGTIEKRTGPQIPLTLGVGVRERWRQAEAYRTFVVAFLVGWVFGRSTTSWSISDIRCRVSVSLSVWPVTTNWRVSGIRTATK